MRLILIDPEQWAITGDYRMIEAQVGCPDITTGSRLLNGSMDAGFDTIFVSDDEMDDGDTTRGSERQL
jgi:hypothetical protein